MRESASSRKKASPGLPKKVREEVVARLEPQMERYLESGAAEGFELSFEGKYLVVAARTSSGRRSHLAPLCRMRYTGNLESWDFEMYRYSRGDFDCEGDFPFSSGSVELCFAVASDFYLWEYDVFEAGSSYDPDAKPREPRAIVGPAFLLPRLAAGARAPCPELPAGLRSTVGGPLLADFSAFVRFIAGRTFKLGKRTHGLGRADLAEANARMTQPLELNLRCVQPQVPRVHVCFRVAEALGLLEVDAMKHRAVGRPDAAAFAELPESERWWAVIEALWQRVRWKGLKANDPGDADDLQAYRVTLGETLTRPVEPVDILRLSWRAEVFAGVLLPSWRDAGLVELERGAGVAKRLGFELERVDVTPLGRWAFERLAEQSPRPDEEEDLERSDAFEDDDESP